MMQLVENTRNMRARINDDYDEYVTAMATQLRTNRQRPFQSDLHYPLLIVIEKIKD
jgi:hypothetical protein